MQICRKVPATRYVNKCAITLLIRNDEILLSPQNILYIKSIIWMNYYQSWLAQLAKISVVFWSY